MRLYLQPTASPRLTLHTPPHVPLVLTLRKGQLVEPLHRKGQHDLSDILDSLLCELQGETLKKDK